MNCQPIKYAFRAAVLSLTLCLGVCYIPEKGIADGIEQAESDSGIVFDSITLGADVYTSYRIHAETVTLSELEITRACQLQFSVSALSLPITEANAFILATVTTGSEWNTKQVLIRNAVYEYCNPCVPADRIVKVAYIGTPQTVTICPGTTSTFALPPQDQQMLQDLIITAGPDNIRIGIGFSALLEHGTPVTFSSAWSNCLH